MAAPDRRGEDRAKPDWGKPPPKPKPPSHARGKPKAGAPRKAPMMVPPPKPTTRTKAAPAKTTTKPKPVAARRGSRIATKRRPAGSEWGRRFQKRYAVVYDTNGPRVRLGIGWFFLALLGIVVGPTGTALVYSVAAAIAAAQLCRVWTKQGMKPSETMASAGALLIGLGACFGAGGGGLGILAAVALAYLGSGDPSSANPRLTDAGWTLQCALVPGIVAMSMVLLTRLDEGSAVALLMLVSVYEIGDYLIGSSANNPYEGPAAGIASIVVVTFIVSTLPISSLDFGQAWLFGGAVALLAPAGQLLASALLPAAASPASALRRLDSLLLTAPLWAWGVGLVL
jgi:hypothetical protein